MKSSSSHPCSLLRPTLPPSSACISSSYACSRRCLSSLRSRATRSSSLRTAFLAALARARRPARWVSLSVGNSSASMMVRVFCRRLTVAFTRLGTRTVRVCFFFLFLLECPKKKKGGRVNTPFLRRGIQLVRSPWRRFCANSTKGCR